MTAIFRLYRERIHPSAGNAGHVTGAIEKISREHFRDIQQCGTAFPYATRDFQLRTVFPGQKPARFQRGRFGVGIRQNICHYLGTDLASEEAIEWATRENNTTKRQNIPGGLGLKLLREFIDLNQGCLQIVSDAGYWCRRSRRTTSMRLDHPFPGTVVSVEINTADQNSCSLSSELATDDIF
jgi:hypothetical protein